jgi:carbon storage regulator
MLVLSRKSRESVVIGSPNGFDHLLKVTVIDVKDGKVKLGIEAPGNLPICRWEVWQRICATGRTLSR